MRYILATAMIVVMWLSADAMAQHHKAPPCPRPHYRQPYVYPPIIVPRQNFGYGPYGVAPYYPYNPYPYPYYTPYYQHQYQYRGHNWSFQFRF